MRYDPAPQDERWGWIWKKWISGLQEFVQNKLDPSTVTVLEYGAKGDGVSDDTAAFQAALDSDAKVILVAGGKSGFVIDSDIQIPFGKTLKSNYEFIDPRNGSDFTDTNYPDRILLNSAASIQMGGSSSIRGLALIRKGSVFPADATEVLNFAGTAIETVAGASVGHYVAHSAIIGFNVAIQPQTASNTEQLRCEYLNIDCNNGINAELAYDSHYIENVHCWPTASVDANSGSPADADLRRPGIGIRLANVSDWSNVTNCFTYGYQRGFEIDGANSCTFLNCGADYTVTQSTNPLGFVIEGNSAETILVGCKSAGQAVGVYINTTATHGYVELVGHRSWECDNHHVQLDDGILNVIGGNMRGGTAAGITPNSAGPTNIVGTRFKDITSVAINNQSASNVVRWDNVIFDNVTTKVVLPYLPSIASATTISLNGMDTVFNITGTNTVTTINSPADYVGKTVYLIFASTATIGSGTQLRLRNGNNFVATQYDMLALASDGSTWYQLSSETNA